MPAKPYLVTGFLTILAASTLPSATALDVTVPPLPVSITSPFVAVAISTDGNSQLGGTNEYSGTFGDNSPRTSESEVPMVAPFDYVITNFYVMAAQANCGGLLAGESFIVTLRVNGADTALTGSCSAGAAANSFTLDTDVLMVTAGQRLTMQYALSGTLLSRDMRLSIAAEGYTVQTASTEETTISVPDPELTLNNATLTLGNSTLHVCGPPRTDGDCAPVRSAGASYWPVWLALGVFAAGVLPQKRNQVVIAFAGLLFMFAAAATPFHEVFTPAQTDAVRLVVVLFGFTVMLMSSMVIQDEVGAERERKRAAKEGGQ